MEETPDNPRIEQDFSQIIMWHYGILSSDATPVLDNLHGM